MFQEGHLFDVMAKGVGAYLEEGAYYSIDSYSRNLQYSLNLIKTNPVIFCFCCTLKDC